MVLKMNDCTCSNCVFTGNGQRYCYDCGKYTKAPTAEELERQIDAIRFAYLDIVSMSEVASDYYIDVDELSSAATETKGELEKAFPWLVEHGKGE